MSDPNPMEDDNSPNPTMLLHKAFKLNYDKIIRQKVDTLERDLTQLLLSHPKMTFTEYVDYINTSSLLSAYAEDEEIFVAIPRNTASYHVLLYLRILKKLI